MPGDRSKTWGGRRTRGLWCLVWGLLCFVAIQAGLTLTMESTWEALRDPEVARKISYLRARQAEHADRPLLLLLGNSRMGVGIRPEDLPRGAGLPIAFNFALPGSGPVMQRILLERLLASGVRPAAVLLEWWPALLMNPEPEATRISVGRLGWHDLAPLSEHCAAARPVHWEWLCSRAVGCYSNRFVLMTEIAPDWLPWEQRRTERAHTISAWGWQPFPSNEGQGTRRRGIERAQAQFGERLRIGHIPPAADRAVRELLDVCRREQVPVGLIYLPEGKVFRSLYRTEEAAERHLAAIRREYGVPVFDTRTWIEEESAFGDSYHLLPAAASAYSQRFGREVLTHLCRDLQLVGEKQRQRMAQPAQHRVAEHRTDGTVHDPVIERE